MRRLPCLLKVSISLRPNSVKITRVSWGVGLSVLSKRRTRTVSSLIRSVGAPCTKTVLDNVGRGLFGVTMSTHQNTGNGRQNDAPVWTEVIFIPPTSSKNWANMMEVRAPFRDGQKLWNIQRIYSLKAYTEKTYDAMWREWVLWKQNGCASTSYKSTSWRPSIWPMSSAMSMPSVLQSDGSTYGLCIKISLSH